jgi:FkbM family methyltransferase
MINFTQLFRLEQPIQIVDVGANAVDGIPPYAELLKNNLAKVIGFEPNEEALSFLNKKKNSNETYLPYCLGDGKIHTLNLCKASGMSSLLMPNYELLNYFYGFPEWAKIEKKVEIETKRLDDLPEIKTMDYLKIDIQGAELMVVENAQEKLKSTLVIDTEVEFVEMYKGQPLFSEVELFMRKQGFVFHKFHSTCSRIMQPLSKANNPFAGLSQQLWADAIFIRDFTKFHLLSDLQLLKLATILHIVYRSYDIVLRLLIEHHKRFGSNFHIAYSTLLTSL